jgi:hypothetical protein
LVHNLCPKKTPISPTLLEMNSKQFVARSLTAGRVGLDFFFYVIKNIEVLMCFLKVFFNYTRIDLICHVNLIV